MDKIFPDGYRVTDRHVFFWGSFLSNFQKTKFTWFYFDEEHEFFCTEQAFMWAKAKFFGDDETANKILDVKDDPMECKRFGREVKNYDDATWSNARKHVMYRVNLSKYSQDLELRDKLLDKIFDGKTFVEASPKDCIWGIGMGLNAEGVDDESNWKGQNLLGQVITDVRNEMKKIYQ